MYMENNRNGFNDSNINQRKNSVKRFDIYNDIKKNKYIIATILFIAVIASYSIWYKTEQDTKVSETNNGKYEIYSETKAYILNKETVVNYKKDETLIPVAESDKRITIGNVIGIYKNAEYDNELAQLAKLDADINQKLELLPEMYSNDVASIDKEIDDITKQMKNVTSYIEMSDYKTKLDELAYKKALTISNLTPSGNDVKQLILQRDQYKQNMNNSSNNVKAPLSGVVVYKTDGLENKYDLSKLDTLPQDALDQLINDYDQVHEENFGIKIVDNYTSYLIIKDDKVNDKYEKENYTYPIELLDKNITINGLLIKKLSTDQYNYCIFKISNNIEDITELRKADVKVVWKQLEGFVVSNNSIKTINNINYVTILSLDKYIDIPVKIILKLENESLVDNYTKDEKTKLNIDSTDALQIYDRVVEIKE